MLSVRGSVIGDITGRLVLDLGAGTGRHAFWAVSQGADVVAIDISFEELSPAPEFFQAIKDQDSLSGDGYAVQASGLMLPFADGAFDLVIASEVFEHIVDDRCAMREVARVVKAGGILCVSVPSFLPESVYWMISSEYHNAPGGHVRIYKRSQILRLAAEAGFRVYRTHRAHALHTPYWLIRCLVGVENMESRLYKIYHRFLVWDITKKPRSTAVLESILNPFGGKSLVVYARKGEGAIS